MKSSQFNKWKSYFRDKKPVVQRHASMTSVFGEFQTVFYVPNKL